MPIVIINSGGSTWTTSEGVIAKITESYTTKNAVHPLPGATKDIIQRLGTSNRNFSVEGIITDVTRFNPVCDYFRTLVGYTGSLGFSNASKVNSDYLTGSTLFTTRTQVYFTDLSFQDVSSRPMERKFTLRAIEVR